MKRKREKPITVRQLGSVNFLSVPDENVLDLRKEKEEEKPAPQNIKNHRIPHTNYTIGVTRRTINFFLLALLVALPVAGITIWQHVSSIEGKVLGASTNAYDSLRQAGDAMSNVDAALAERQFDQAAASFREARQTLDGFRFVLNGLTEALPVVSKVKTARALLSAGEDLAQAGASLSAITQPMLLPEKDRTLDFPAVLQLAQKQLPPALDKVDAAVQSVKKVRAKDLPESLRPQFAKIQSALPSITSGLTTIRNGSDVLLNLVGGQRTRRYLVLFQNNMELRPTGGFLGSLALIDVADGKVSHLEVPGGGTYDFQGQLTKKVISPEPLHLVNPVWQLQDANWWPDFPTSAKKIVWFYENSGGPTVDGVLALTPDVIIDLLKTTGPIDLQEQYGVTITPDNFVQEALLAKEATPEKPKQIIADLVPVLLDKLLTTPSVDQLSLLAVFERAVQQKQLLLYSPDAKEEANIAALGWGGNVLPATRDALMVVDTNIGGGKTDGVIDEKIDHVATIQADGSIVDSVTITRTHQGVPNDPVTGIRNVDFIRFYVPKGSTLISADGFERIEPTRFQSPPEGYSVDPDIERIEGRPVVDELTQTRTSAEFGYTVFANWLGVGPGETATAHLTYRLPFTLNLKKGLFSSASDEYSLFVQKQPGTSGRFLTSTIQYPSSLKLSWTTQQNSTTQAESGLVRTSTPLDADQLIGIVLSTK